MCRRLSRSFAERPQSGLWIEWRRTYAGPQDCRPETDQHLEWPPQALLDKAPLGWAGRRRRLVSWTRLAISLGGTKRERERAHFVVTSPPLHRDPITPQPVAVEMLTPWCISSGALCPLLVPSRGGENYWAWLPRHSVARRALDPLRDAEENRIHSPESSTWRKKITQV